MSARKEHDYIEYFFSGLVFTGILAIVGSVIYAQFFLTQG